MLITLTMSPTHYSLSHQVSTTFAFSNLRLEFIPNRRLVESFSFYRKLAQTRAMRENINIMQ